MVYASRCATGSPAWVICRSAIIRKGQTDILTNAAQLLCLKPREVTLDALVALLVLIIALIFYFLPTFIAERSKHLNAGAIFVLNLLLGWTFIGWVAALVWACTNNPRTKRVAEVSPATLLADPSREEYAEFAEYQRWKRTRQSQNSLPRSDDPEITL